MISEDQLSGLTKRLTKSKNCAIRLIWLSSVPILLFLFALFGYLGIINFNVQIHSTIMIGLILLIYLSFMRDNAYYASCKLRSNFLKIRLDLITYINKNLLYIAGLEKANASLEDFLKEVSKTLRNENFSSVAAGIFPTLGILGTFISIAISMPDFTSQTSQALEHEISKLLGGVGTAFYVSIYGIFLSLWWIFFEKNGTSRFQKDSLTIKEATHDFFWQKEEIEQTYFRKSMENFEKLNTVFDTFSSQEFIKSLNKTLEQRMSVFEQIIEHEQEATNKVAKLLYSGTNQLQIISQQQNELSNTLQNIIYKFENFANNLEKQNINFNKAHDTLSDDFSKAVEVAQMLSENSSKLNEALSNISVQNVQNLYSGVIENIESMKQEIDKIGSGLDEKINSFDDLFLQKLKNTLKLIDSETAQIVSQISKLKD